MKCTIKMHNHLNKVREQDKQDKRDAAAKAFVAAPAARRGGYHA